MITVNIHDAKTQLSKLVEQAAQGESFIIAKAGKPMAKLVPAGRPARRRKPGGWKGRVVIRKDFEAKLPPALRAAFEGRR